MSEKEEFAAEFHLEMDRRIAAVNQYADVVVNALNAAKTGGSVHDINRHLFFIGYDINERIANELANLSVVDWSWFNDVSYKPSIMARFNDLQKSIDHTYDDCDRAVGYLARIAKGVNHD